MSNLVWESDDDGWWAETSDGIRLALTIERDDIPVRGNASAWDDEQANTAYADDILERLEQGDDWAWASVKVSATALGEEGIAFLGGCSYEGFAEFAQPDGYLPQMVSEAIADLCHALTSAVAKASEIKAWLEATDAK